MSPHDRVEQFPDDHFSVVCARGKLFCIACRENLSLKKSVVTIHVQPTKHANGLEHLASKEKRERTLAEMLIKQYYYTGIIMIEYTTLYYSINRNVNNAHRK